MLSPQCFIQFDQGQLVLFLSHDCYLCCNRLLFGCWSWCQKTFFHAFFRFEMFICFWLETFFIAVWTRLDVFRYIILHCLWALSKRLAKRYAILPIFLVATTTWSSICHFYVFIPDVWYCWKQSFATFVKNMICFWNIISSIENHSEQRIRHYKKFTTSKYFVNTVVVRSSSCNPHS